MDYSKLSTIEKIEATIKALEQNGIRAMFLDTREDAKLKVLELIPVGSEVLNMTSVTLDSVGITHIIREGGKYIAARNKMANLDTAADGDALKLRGLRSSAEWVVGSAHAVTEDGKVMIASYTGSQLAAYVYGASKLIWIVGTQKIVPDFESGLRRIYDYCLPLEIKRVKMEGGQESAVNKVLVVSREVEPGRITLIFVNEVLGF